MNRLHIPPSMLLSEARTIMLGRKTELTARAKRDPKQYAFFPGSVQAKMREALCDAIKRINIFEMGIENEVFAISTIADLFNDGDLDTKVFITSEEPVEEATQPDNTAAMLATVSKTPPEARV